MLIPGYCQDCHRIRTVRVSNAGMMQVAQGRTAVGQCNSCADAEARKRREQREARRVR